MSIPAFVINLPKDKDRKVFMENQLQEAGFDYEIIEAYDGRGEEANLAYDDAVALKENGRSLSFGERGCSLSHRVIYEKIVKEHIPFALVFEDDAKIPENFKDIVEREIKRHNNVWDFLLFEYVPTGGPYLKEWIEASYKRTKQNPLFALYFLLKAPYVLLVSLYEVIERFLYRNNPTPRIFFRPLYHASAYLLTKEGAEKLLKLTYPIRFSADRLPNQARIKSGLRLRGYVPLLVRQNKKFPSNIV